VTSELMKRTDVDWTEVKAYEDITYHKGEGIARIAFDRPEVRNAFRPDTLKEMQEAFEDAHEDSDVGVVLLAANGPSPEDGVWSFCAGGDQSVRGEEGYVGEDDVPRLNVLKLQRTIRTMPKPVIAVVPDYAIGGGHVLHVVCDMTIAAEGARFGQTGPKVGSFDAGFGSATLARHIGQKKAREIWFLCREYEADEAEDMGMVNTVVPLEKLEVEAVDWAHEILQKSPTAIAACKAAMNADMDAQTGLQVMGGQMTRLFYQTDEGQEGRDAFNEDRDPEFDQFPWLR
jgi:naphthoate synthase